MLTSSGLDPHSTRITSPDLQSARSMVASLVRFEGFHITLTVCDDEIVRVASGTPSEILRELEACSESTTITQITSVLAATRTPPAGLRLVGWWG
ncbi:hypothetical protein AB0L40_11755 [Patulibacter sp. NPDC049589]|uniref:hypothetical protein n=1 Tax=Patulibacter sp. NPDC049589 TaxID=3154731 RepID=UPI00342CCEFE